MDELKRYDFVGELGSEWTAVQEGDGDYCLYSDAAAEIERLRGAVETERNRHRAWTDYFQTNQLTHAASRLEAAEDEVRRLRARVAELEKFEASMRCPNCDNLRLEIGQLRRRVAELEVYREICVDLRAKVERGEAKSVRTYGRIVDAMSKEVGHDG